MTNFHVSQCPNNLKCMSVGSHPTHHSTTLLNFEQNLQNTNKYGDKTNWVLSSLASQYYQEQLK